MLSERYGEAMAGQLSIHALCLFVCSAEGRFLCVHCSCLSGSSTAKCMEGDGLCAHNKAEEANERTTLAQFVPRVPDACTA